MIRLPAVAGSFYEGERGSLLSRIEWCYTHPHGPGGLPTPGRKGKKVLGLVSPHAGYMYSGPVAAHGYALLASSPPETVVVLGPNHTGMGSGVSLSPHRAWRTPLGEVEVDGELSRSIAEECELIDLDELAHQYEHSIEVQLPFLQHLFGSRFKLVAICMMLQDERTSEQVGRALAEALEGRKAVVIASTDFTHYEPQERARKKDEKALRRIEALDWRGLLRTVEEEDITMCGYGPVAAMLRACSELGAREGELLKYATSGDTAGPMPEVVGYGSLAVTG
ncbi:MAG: AmmeMemoRadiSam system protein B [Candidatus Hadarchaeales archaeon]